ncbi:hypothetical protein RI129_012174 [Pyrocoelia pectoralis]|uniref:Importin N-terminal domain-containing protein n=1 Tax=Pyrocoelia pectoralis TaxID=417401 RepID=A0AAN7ZEG3_9COLE
MALKEALLEIISGLLSSSTELLNVAEERKKAMEVMEEYPILLTEILLTEDEATEERQMAGVLLKQCIYSFWWKTAADLPPILSDSVKQRLRSLLPNGLKSTSSVVRNSCASSLLHIGKSDYPFVWPDMVNNIVSKLDSVDENTCSGILYFLNDYVRVAVTAHISQSALVIYKFLYSVAQELEYTTHTRAKAIMIFANFSSRDILLTNSELTNIIVNFCMVCHQQLTLSHPDESDYILKHNILNAYTRLLTKIPAVVMKPIVEILPTIWEMLYRCGIIFDGMLVNETLPYRDPEENDQNTPFFYLLIENIFDFVKSILKIDPNIPEITNVLPDLVYHIILFLAIPKDMEVRWKSDPEIYFSEDFEEECSENSMRLGAKQFLMILVKKIHTPIMINALKDAVDRHLLCCSLKTESYYWRVHEATIYAVGSLKKFILSVCSQEQIQGFDISNYLNRWAAELGPCPSWLMLARIMWLGGQYALILGNNASTYIRTIADNLSASSFILTYSAIRSLLLHMRTVNESEYKSVYIELRHTLAHSLMDTLDELDGAILPMGLSALVKLLKLDPFADCIAIKLTCFIINIFDKNLPNFKILDHLHVIIKEICSNNTCGKTFENEFLPLFVELTNPMTSTNNRQLASYNVQCNAISILTILVKYSNQPISNELIIYGFVPISTFITRVDDSCVVQLGAECLRSFLCKATSKILMFQDNDGRSGADYVINILKCILDPIKTDFMSEEVGRFYITSMNTLGSQLDQHFSFLLRGLLSAVQRAVIGSVKETLLGIFSYLFYYNFSPVVHYLTLIPGPKGQSALAFILGKLSSTKYSFDKKYFLHLHTIAICRIVEHAVIQQDQRILNIKVQHTKEEFHQPNCSSTSVTNTEVPILLDIIKALIETLDWIMSRVAVTEVCSESRHGWKRSLMLASTSRENFWNTSDDSFSDNSESVSSVDEDSIIEDILDPLDLNDPIYNIDVLDYLKNFFKNCAENQYFCNYAQLLNKCEKEFLRRIN